MNKELFVTSTPHETKVGIAEDDQLAEIYLERENEYTLAGSIYKGRVTRVLPGMQSAFVDIGLERDAFLYVSDFMDLEQQDEDLSESIPTNRPGNGGQNRRTEMPAIAGETAEADLGNRTGEINGSSSTVSEPGNVAEPAREGRDFRGRRRRRGRRGDNERSGFDRAEGRPDEQRGERSGRFDRGSSSSRFQRPASTTRPGRDYDYGPPPGYQPIILPGESISKYQQQTANRAPASEAPAIDAEARNAIAASFPGDEPMFAAAASEPRHEEHDHVTETEVYADASNASVEAAPAVAEFRAEVEQTKMESTIGALDEEETAELTIPHESDFAAVLGTPEERASDIRPQAGGPVEEQEIEEEEADLVAYGEDLEEDDDFEEVEEEIRSSTGEVVAGASNGDLSTPLRENGEASESPENGEVSEAALEAEEREAEEMELEEAQAEAEALLEAEAIGEGTADASAEVRGPAQEAKLLQRPQRRFDRGGDFDKRRGGRRGQRRRFRSRENQVVPQISELLKEGQEILVQIAKEPIGKKGARITSHIALPGRFLVFMPTVNHTGVSRKIASEEERQRLKHIIQSERENGGGGFIVRTAAAGASDEELRADIRFLKNLWSEIKSRSESSKSPALIYHDLNVVERVLRDQVSSDFSVIWVDTETEYERILRFANRFQPALVKRVKLYTKETPLFEQFGLNDEINKALKSKVWLKSGGYIVINQTEALVAIDVNTGKYVGKTSRLEDTIVKTNVDAIREIVRQIRLRDLGGIIIIDFIDMDERRNRQKVMQALEEALRADRAPSKVLQFNDFGLVAITRKRVKQSLERTIGSPCPYCQATGFVKAVNTVCNEIYVEMRKISQHLEHNDVMLRVNPEVAKALKLNNARLLNEMEELAKKTIIVKSDPALHQEQFDIH